MSFTDKPTCANPDSSLSIVYCLGKIILSVLISNNKCN